MGEVQKGADGDIDLHLGRNDEHDGMQVDTAMAVAARAFGAPLSIKMPFWKAAAIDAEAARVQTLDADKFTIANGQKSKAQLQDEADEESHENLLNLVAIMEEQREFDEWMRTRSSIGGVEMTGQEWAEFAARLRRDDDLREKVVAAFKEQGMSEAEATRRYERVADVSEAMAVPPSQRTEEQTSLIEKAKSDPSFGSDMKTAHSFYSGGQSPKAEIVHTTAPTVAALDGPGM